MFVYLCGLVTYLSVQMGELLNEQAYEEEQ